MPNDAAFRSSPSLGATIQLLKPITWFAPMWAFACGVVSSGQPIAGHNMAIVLGVLLCGPLVCGASQAMNDWYDRDVDAINEPHRPIPSGRVPGNWGLWIAIVWSAVALLVSTALGRFGFGGALIGLALAWLYSAPPLRLKENGWVGNLACAICYEGMPWIVGAAVMTGEAPDARVYAVALLYSLGAHGIMTLNDFKAIEGDRARHVYSLPVLLGPDAAARVACWFMGGAQLVVLGLLITWGYKLTPLILALLIVAQWMLMTRLIADPRGKAPWYNATGTTLYVLGMMACAVALRP